MTADPNPYASPNSDAVATSPPRDSRAFALRRIRIATVIGITVTAIECAPVAWRTLRYGRLRVILDEAYLEMTLIRYLVLAVLLLAGWFLIYPAVRIISQTLRRLFARHVSALDWQVATDDALWTLPYGATAGVVIWHVYTYVAPYGETSDIIYGALGWGVGAWSVGTILFRWIRVSRQTKRDVTD